MPRKVSLTSYSCSRVIHVCLESHEYMLYHFRIATNPVWVNDTAALSSWLSHLGAQHDDAIKYQKDLTQNQLARFAVSVSVTPL